MTQTHKESKRSWEEMEPIDLLDEGLPQTFDLFKKKKKSSKVQARSQEQKNKACLYFCKDGSSYTACGPRERTELPVGRSHPDCFDGMC